ncbi:MAG: class I SAM-dependent methyltransferase [Methanomassiliicoccaceae archaeon]|nr:class I SAM-dependent methyltransferase [Methanomassiliicoccaceae archaeon]
MIVPRQKDAWDELYRSQFRPWKGVTSDTVFPFKKGAKILDVGCGNGKTSFALMEAGYNVVGIDISDVAVETYNRMYEGRMKAICASAASIPMEDGEMDGAVMIHVLEHMTEEESKQALAELRRVLRPDSRIFVRVFHKDDMRSGKGERIDDNTVVRGNGIRYRYFTEAELKTLFSDLSEISMRRIEDKTKFREIRSKIEAVFEIP